MTASAPAAPAAAVVIDAAMFPHIIEAVFQYAPHASLLVLRRFSRGFLARADLCLTDHLVEHVVECTDRDGGDGAEPDGPRRRRVLTTYLDGGRVPGLVDEDIPIQEPDVEADGADAGAATATSNWLPSALARYETVDIVFDAARRKFGTRIGLPPAYVPTLRYRGIQPGDFPSGKMQSDKVVFFVGTTSVQYSPLLDCSFCAKRPFKVVINFTFTCCDTRSGWYPVFPFGVRHELGKEIVIIFHKITPPSHVCNPTPVSHTLGFLLGFGMTTARSIALESKVTFVDIHTLNFAPVSVPYDIQFPVLYRQTQPDDPSRLDKAGAQQAILEAFAALHDRSGLDPDVLDFTGVTFMSRDEYRATLSHAEFVLETEE